MKMQTEDRSGDIESLFIKGNSSPGCLGKQQENYVSHIKIKKHQLLRHQSMTGTLGHSGKEICLSGMLALSGLLSFTLGG